MNVEIIYHLKNLEKVRGLVVVIDVLRAFTTACFIANNNPKEYIVVHDLDLAYKLKKENPDYLLLGERNGFNLPGFDYGNSPAEIEHLDFSGKTVVHTTTLGTQGIVGVLKHASEVITGSFVNAGAVINYIKSQNSETVSLFCTDGSSEDNEDAMFAKYVKGYLENKPLKIKDIEKHLINHKSGRMYLETPRTKHSKKDFFLALELDRFNFVLKAHLEKDNLIRLEKINPSQML